MRKYSKGRYARHGVYWFVYVLLGPVGLPLHQIYDAYRKRFGIESTYRLMNQVRAKTSSRRPELLAVIRWRCAVFNQHLGLSEVDLSGAAALWRANCPP